MSKSIHEGLATIQRELKAPKGQTNEFANFKFRSCEDILEALKPHLNGYTLVITDDIILLGDRYYIKATATISNGKESMSATGIARETQTKKGMDDSQITGATSSYARKYALNGLFCIDDTKDADSTNTHGKEPKQSSTTQSEQPKTQNNNQQAKKSNKEEMSPEDINKLKEQIHKLCENMSPDEKREAIKKASHYVAKTTGKESFIDDINDLKRGNYDAPSWQLKLTIQKLQEAMLSQVAGDFVSDEL
jgi:flagellar biosynthesis GTPase FlhF